MIFLKDDETQQEVSVNKQLVGVWVESSSKCYIQVLTFNNNFKLLKFNM